MPSINIPLSRYVRRKLKKLRNVAALAAKLNFTVAIKERFRNQLISLDSVKQKLLFIRKEKDIFDCKVIDLQDLENCSVKKEYGSIKAGDLETRGLNYYLKSISLHLGFKNGAKPLVVSFYDSGYHTVNQQNRLEAAAKKWEGFLSPQLKKPAA